MPAHPCDNLVVVENSDGMSAEEHSSLEATGGDAEEEEAMTKLSTAIVTANQGRVIQHLRLPHIIQETTRSTVKTRIWRDGTQCQGNPEYLSLDERAIYDAKMVEESRVFGSSLPYS